MRLIVFLSLGDFLLAIGELPYVIYITVNWNPIQLDYDPWLMMLLAQPLPLQLKVSAIITVGIALGRCIALFSPSLYRRMDQGDYSLSIILLSILFAIFDDFLYWYLTKLERHPDCGGVGCFVSDQFLHYWGLSNMIFGLMTVFLSASIFLKLRVVAKQKGSLNSHQGQNKYMKAHRTSTGILMSSLLFLTLPSVCVGIVELTGFSVFKLIGAFYLACLLVSGCCNASIFIWSNWDAVRAKKVSSSILVQKASAGLSVIPTGPSYH
ncbi:unnamed protein product [Caenorhabditis nigoni]